MGLFPWRVKRIRKGLSEQGMGLSRHFFHPSTNQAWLCLTSEIRRDRACSGLHTFINMRCCYMAFSLLCCSLSFQSPKFNLVGSFLCMRPLFSDINVYHRTFNWIEMGRIGIYFFPTPCCIFNHILKYTYNFILESFILIFSYIYDRNMLYYIQMLLSSSISCFCFMAYTP